MPSYHITSFPNMNWFSWCQDFWYSSPDASFQWPQVPSGSCRHVDRRGLGWEGGNEATYQGEDHHNGILMGFNGILWNFNGILMGFNGIYDGYPLVNCYITMENHHVEWENSLFQWPFSIANC